MKIYTEVNYKWLDGQLVKTDSKSFEYEGELILCSFGGGGGGGADPITAAVTSVAETVDDVVTDPVGTATDIAGDVVTTAGEGVSVGADVLGSGLEQTMDVVTEGLETGTEVLGEQNLGIMDELAAVGENINTNMAPIVAEGKRWTDAATTNINYALGFIGEKGQELTDAIYGPSTPSDIVIDPDKFAVDASKKKKNKSDLAVHKAKKRARKSLRIG